MDGGIREYICILLLNSLQVLQTDFYKGFIDYTEKNTFTIWLSTGTKFVFLLQSTFPTLTKGQEEHPLKHHSSLMFDVPYFILLSYYQDIIWH